MLVYQIHINYAPKCAFQRKMANLLKLFFQFFNEKGQEVKIYKNKLDTDKVRILNWVDLKLIQDLDSDLSES